MKKKRNLSAGSGHEKNVEDGKSKDSIKIYLAPYDDIAAEKKSQKKKSITRVLLANIQALWKKFRDSKIGKILFSDVFGYAVSVVSIAIILSGIIVPVSPIAIGVATATAVGVGVQVISTSRTIHALRKLQKENNLLVQYRGAKDSQDYILSVLPDLHKVLEQANIPDEGRNILKPNIENSITKVMNNAVSKHHISERPNSSQETVQDRMYKLKTHIKKISAKTASANTGTIASLGSYILESASGNVLSIIKATGYGVFTSVSLISGALTEKERYDIRSVFKMNINEERKRPDAPVYNDIKELEDRSIAQMIQTVALKKLITSQQGNGKNYWNMNDHEKKIRFNAIKTAINNEIDKGGVGEFLKKHHLALDNKDTSVLKSSKKILNPFFVMPNRAQSHTDLSKARKKGRYR